MVARPRLIGASCFVIASLGGFALAKHYNPTSPKYAAYSGPTGRFDCEQKTGYSSGICLCALQNFISPYCCQCVLDCERASAIGTAAYNKCFNKCSSVNEKHGGLDCERKNP